MKIRLKTGETVDVRDEYGLRLIEQDKGVFVPEAPKGEKKAETAPEPMEAKAENAPAKPEGKPAKKGK